jgi:MFS transporter, YNFM family, putative membrane transport protein
LFVGGFVTFAILYSVQPLMPVFSRQFGVTPAVASLSLSLATGTLAVFMLVAAALSESRGRKIIMTLSLFSSAVLALLISFSPDFFVLLGLRALQGMVLAGLPSIAMAYVGEEFHPGSLGLAMGLYVSGTTAGGMVGRIGAGVLADAYSWRVALGAIGALGLLCSLWFLIGLPASAGFTPQPIAKRRLLEGLIRHAKDPGLLCIFGLGFLLMGGFVALYNYIGYLLVGPPYYLSQAALGSIFVVYLAGTFSSAWMGKLAGDFGGPRILLAGIAIMFAGGLLTLSGNLYAIIAGVAVYTFGFFGSHSVASSWVGQRATTDKAQASSLYLLFYYAGSSLFGAVGGLFWNPYGWYGVVSMIMVLLLLALLLTGLLSAVPPQRSETSQAQ